MLVWTVKQGYFAIMPLTRPWHLYSIHKIVYLVLTKLRGSWCVVMCHDASGTSRNPGRKTQGQTRQTDIKKLAVTKADCCITSPVVSLSWPSAENFDGLVWDSLSGCFGWVQKDQDMNLSGREILSCPILSSMMRVFGARLFIWWLLLMCWWVGEAEGSVEVGSWKWRDWRQMGICCCLSRRS